MAPATLSKFSIASKIAILALFLNTLCSCCKNHLYVQQEVVSREFLASSHAGTPDPRQAHPPKGRRLLIAWDFPRSAFLRGLTLVATVRLWDNTEQTFSFPLERKRGSLALPFVEEDQRILTYLVQVFSEGKVVDQWKHHFWTELIKVGE